MKKLFIIVLSALSLTAFAQQKKVAVYVTGQETGINKVLGDQLVAAFAKSGKYTAIERTASFLAELGKEQNYQRTGAVSDNEIARLGNQFGVQYVCVAEISEVFGEKYISARLIDVETAEIINTHNVSGEMTNMNACLRMAGEIADYLSKGSFAEQKKEAQVNAEIESRNRAEAEKKRKQDELTKRNNIIRQQLSAGYLKLGSFYVTKTLAMEKSEADAKKWLKKCMAGGWSDWRLPTYSEVQWIRYCMKSGSPYDDVVDYLIHNDWGQYANYSVNCIWYKGGLDCGNCPPNGKYYVILVRGSK